MCSLYTRSFSACGSSSQERTSCTSISRNFMGSSVVSIDDLMTQVVWSLAESTKCNSGQRLIFCRAGLEVRLRVAATAESLAGLLLRTFFGADIRYPSLRIAAV